MFGYEVTTIVTLATKIRFRFSADSDRTLNLYLLHLASIKLFTAYIGLNGGTLDELVAGSTPRSNLFVSNLQISTSLYKKS